MGKHRADMCVMTKNKRNREMEVRETNDSKQE